MAKQLSGALGWSANLFFAFDFLFFFFFSSFSFSFSLPLFFLFLFLFSFSFSFFFFSLFSLHGYPFVQQPRSNMLMSFGQKSISHLSQISATFGLFVLSHLVCASIFRVFELLIVSADSPARCLSSLWQHFVLLFLPPLVYNDDGWAPTEYPSKRQYKTLPGSALVASRHLFLLLSLLFFLFFYSLRFFLLIECRWSVCFANTLIMIFQQ
jgi:hypothetical protein